MCMSYFMVLKVPFINLLIPSRWDVAHRMCSSWSETIRTNKADRLKLHQVWVTKCQPVMMMKSFALCFILSSLCSETSRQIFVLHFFLSIAGLNSVIALNIQSLNWVLFPLAEMREHAEWSTSDWNLSLFIKVYCGQNHSRSILQLM